MHGHTILKKVTYSLQNDTYNMSTFSPHMPSLGYPNTFFVTCVWVESVPSNVDLHGAVQSFKISRQGEVRLGSSG